MSIDIPSGMSSDSSSFGNEIIKANHTVSFQAYKLAFLLPENVDFLGNIHIAQIGLNTSYLQKISPVYEMVYEDLIKSIYKKRNPYSHKGNYGHALIVAGNNKMMGATILCAKACMRSGVGKLTCYVDSSGYPIMNNALPECVNEPYPSPYQSENHFNAVGIGPGMSDVTNQETVLKELFIGSTRMVIDAGLLNTLSGIPDLLKYVPALSILTPHPKEFERLFGKCTNDFEQLERARQKAKELNVIIVLKGHHSFIAMPGGKAYFNTTGNPGMATAGSGDVLTGILTGLLAQNYTQEQAALLGVYLHGLAGNIAASKCSEEAMIASDIIDCLGEAFKQL
jgi:NAD(P)H-hydrate epimerase